MSLFGCEGVKAVIADIGFTVTIGSMGYEARHVSDPCIVSTAYRLIEISGFCSSKRGICFGDIGNSMPLTFRDVK